MNFDDKYKELVQSLSDDFDRLDTDLDICFSKKQKQENQVLPILKEFFVQKGKRIRSSLIFLFAKSLNKPVDDFVYRIALATELLHNATLIHDDIIDCAMFRRNEKTLNFNYDSKLAVLAGDYLLAEVLKILGEVDLKQVRNCYSEAVSDLLRGEINQYFNRFKILPIDKYIEKSKNKTAKLFEAALMSIGYYYGLSQNELAQVRKFAQNFGIGFQIHNDLKNFDNIDKVNEDIKNGDYSAPIIYYMYQTHSEKSLDINNVNIVLKQLKKTDAIEKAEHLKERYFNLAIENTSFLVDNQYKNSIVELCKLYL